MGRSVAVPRDSTAVCYTELQDIYEDCWDIIQDDIIDTACNLYPSMREVPNKWIGNELRVLLENDHAYIGVSEYCGLVSIWMVCKADYRESGREGFARAWCERAKKSFEEAFGDLIMVGRFSNGECVFERKEG